MMIIGYDGPLKEYASCTGRNGWLPCSQFSIGSITVFFDRGMGSPLFEKYLFGIAAWVRRLHHGHHNYGTT